MRPDAGALRAELGRLEAEGLHRRRRTVEVRPGPGTTAIIDGRCLVNFCSNDYLGLAQHPDVSAALRSASKRWGTGSGASHLVSGHSREHARLEEALAAWTGRERALLFSTGYMANLGVVEALVGRGDLLVEDRLDHASLIDAARLSGARLRRYAHGDATSAATALQSSSGGTALLATDGVFSMDGDLAPLPELAVHARARGAWLLVDDAHGLGVLGSSGSGTLEHLGLDAHDVPVLIGTLGKALGTFGAFVAGSAELIEYLIQRARTAVFTTAMPPALAAATCSALELAVREHWRRERLHSLIARFRAAAHAEGLPLAASETPIQPLVLGSPERALAASAALERAGFWVAAIRPPTVPRGSARLRVTLSAAHEDAQVDALVEALKRALREGHS
ncbi:MAG: 8-amino-7-oxononanoate synthase [Gammaproteobacteria bacterium]|nr:8-amino-7-oxononanoate synthase [Gammaproteobacteria bacterium]